MRLREKTAIVTGGASGFGAGIVRKFVAEGANVVIADLNAVLAHELVEELATDLRNSVAGDCSNRLLVAHTDVTDDASVQATTQLTLDAFHRIDILVNNAGTTHLPGATETIGESEFDRVFAVNCKSVYLSTRHIVPLMKAQASGCILNVASTAAVSPRPNLSWYNASKGWLTTATRGLAVELAPFGLRVNALNPVAGETPLLKSFMGEDTPAMREKFLATIPLGRFSTPEDMGNAACYLCSDEASMVTGVCLEVDGGRCI